MAGDITARKLIVGVGLSTRDLDRQAAQVQRSFQKLGKQLERSGAALSKSFTLPLAGIGAAAIAAAKTFDDGFAQIRRGTGATGQQLESLKKTFQSLNLQVANSTRDVSIAVADLNTRLGLQGKELEAVAKQSLNLARITGSDVGQTIATVTRVFGDWSIKIDDVAAAQDYLFKVSQTTGISIDNLGRLVVQYGEPLRQFGFTFEEAAALMGKFEKEGVNSALVFAGLKQSIARFADAGIPLKQGFEAVSAAIKNASTETEAINIAMKVFGRDGASDLAGAIRAGRFEIDGLVRNLSTSQETINKASEESKTFTERLFELGKAIQAAFEPLGSQIVKDIGPIIQSITEVVRTLAEAFINLSEPTRQFIIVAGGIAAIAGPITIALGTIVAGLAAILSPISAVVLAMGGLAAAVYAFSDDITKAFRRIKQAAAVELGAVSDGLNVLKNLAVESAKALSPFSESKINFLGTGANSPLNQAIQLTAAQKQLNQTFSDTVKSADQVKQKFSEQSSEIEKAASAIGAAQDQMSKLAGATGEAIPPSNEFADALEKMLGKGSSFVQTGSSINSMLGTTATEASAAADEIARLADQLNDVRRNNALSDIRSQLSGASSDTEYSELRNRFAELSKEGFLSGMSQAARESDIGVQLADEQLRPELERLDQEREQSLIDAHKNAVDSWRGYFENAITGVTFDLEDVFKQIAVGFAADLAASVFGSEGFGSPQEFGSTLASYFSGSNSNELSGTNSESSAGLAAATFGIYAAFKGFEAFFNRLGDKEKSQFKTGNQNTGEAVQSAQIAGADTIGFGSIAEQLINSPYWKYVEWYFDPIGTVLKGAQKAFGIFGTNDVETAFRKGVQEVFTEALQNATGGNGLQLFNPNGGAARLDVINFLGGQSQFNGGGGFDFLQSLDSEAQSVFIGLAEAFSRIFELPEGFDTGQLAVLFSENLLGDIDNAKILVKQLGLSFEEAKAAILDAALIGDLSWKDFNATIAGLEKAFEPGLEGLGNVEKAIDQLISSAGKGLGPVEALRNIAFEFAEQGGTFEGLAQRLQDAGLSFEDAQLIIDQFASRGVSSLDDIINASDEFLGGIVGSLDAAGFGFAELTDDVVTVRDAFNELNNIQLKAKELEVRVIATGDVDILNDTGAEKYVSPDLTGGDPSTAELKTSAARFRSRSVPQAQKGIVLNIDARGAAPGVEQSIIRAIRVAEERAVNRAVNAVHNDFDRGR